MAPLGNPAHHRMRVEMRQRAARLTLQASSRPMPDTESGRQVDVSSSHRRRWVRVGAYDPKPTLPSLTMAGQLARCRPAVGLVLCIGAGNFHSSATDSHSRLWVENPEPFSRQQ